MKSQNSKEKSQYLDRLLSTYEKSIKNDELDIRRHKEQFINEIKKFNKREISNTFEIKPQGISLWKRIKKALGIG
jgi:hypothetical protein